MVVREVFAQVQVQYRLKKEKSEQVSRTHASHFLSTCGCPLRPLQKFLQKYLEKNNYQFSWMSGGGENYVDIYHPDAASAQSLVNEMCSAGRARNWDLSCILRAKVQLQEFYYVPQCSTGRTQVPTEESNAAEV